MKKFLKYVSAPVVASTAILLAVSCGKEEMSEKKRSTIDNVEKQFSAIKEILKQYKETGTMNPLVYQQIVGLLEVKKPEIIDLIKKTDDDKIESAMLKYMIETWAEVGTSLQGLGLDSSLLESFGLGGILNKIMSNSN
ncbi:hypothetical protein [Mycoplasmopsis iners]|uniref:hypothetical protein n=1 Tax=Mycoplasmopsis iners TaxID=76630 RepID=UPI000494EFC0|nr:hypothetical protein [Mycoplasmopsis iners]